MSGADVAPVAPASVLLVEHQANEREGHFMKELEAYANAMAADGHTVHVLADGPLAIEHEGRSLSGAAGVHRVDSRWSRLARRGERWSTLGLGGRWPAVARPIRGIGYVLLQWSMTRGVASCAARIGGVPTLVFSRKLRADWASVFAPRSARWAIYEGFGPRASGPGRSRVADRLSARRERRREQSGGWVRLVANSPAVVERWRGERPWLVSDVVPLAGVPNVTPEPRDRARAELALERDEPIALVFGAAHRGKDIRTILLAFAGEGAPGRLVAAGAGMRSLFDDVRRERSELSFPSVTVVDGPQTDEAKRMLHSAADYVVLSYRRDRENDSGTLADAVAYGLPVCCSDECATADVVDEYRLGLLFAPGDPASLRECAAHVATFAVRPEDRDRFVQSWSVAALSRRMLAATTTL